MNTNKKTYLLKGEKRSFSSSSLARDGKKSRFGGSSNPKMLKERTQSFTATLDNTIGISKQISTGASSKNKAGNSASSLFFSAKQDSESKIQFKLASDDNLLRESSFVKDLPMTESYQSMAKDVDVYEFKTGVLSMARNAYDRAYLSETDNTLFFDFLASHSFKILQFLSKAGAAVNDSLMEWKALTFSKSKNDLALAINVWATIQETYMDFIVNREKSYTMLLEEFEVLEERNLLLQDFLAQKLSYSTSSTMEIQVKQIIKPAPEPTESTTLPPQPQVAVAKPESLAVPVTLNAIEENQTDPIIPQALLEVESSMQQVLAEISTFLGKPKFKAKRSTLKSNASVMIQTDPISINSDRPYVDLMDRATGPDREIAVYRGVGIQADFRHPLEEKYEKISVAYQFLEQEHKKAKLDSIIAIEELKSEFKTKIEVQTNDSKSKIAKLDVIILDLKQEKDRLENELSTTTLISAQQQNELQAVREKIAKVTDQLESVTKEEEFQRKTRLETEQILQKTKDEIVVISKAVEQAVEVNIRLQGQKLQLEENEVLSRKKIEKIEEVLAKTEISYQEAKKAELKLNDISNELKKEQARREEMVTLNETLRIENEFVKEVEDRLNEKNSDLEKIIAKLMEFPDLSLGANFNLKSLPNTPEFTSTLHHMIEHNNLRISLLEQRNKIFRDTLLDQSKKIGNDKYSLYHPVSSTTVIFNMNAIDLKSRPTTADSSCTLTEKKPATTYILGQSFRSRPVSAVSIRLLRPASGKNVIEQALQKPIFARLTEDGASIQIDEGAKTKYPPTRFSFLAPSNPLSIYDSSLMEDAPAPGGTGAVKGPQKCDTALLRSALKGSRPPTAKTRPTSAVTFKWENE